MIPLQEKSEEERRICDVLRSYCLIRIEELGSEVAREKLGLLPAGVKTLTLQKHWSLEKAFRVSKALDIDIILTVKPNHFSHETM